MLLEWQIYLGFKRIKIIKFTYIYHEMFTCIHRCSCWWGWNENGDGDAFHFNSFNELDAKREIGKEEILKVEANAQQLSFFLQLKMNKKKLIFLAQNYIYMGLL